MNATAEQRQARVIARACYQHAAKRTGDIDEMRAAALDLNATYGTDRQPDGHEEDLR